MNANHAMSETTIPSSVRAAGDSFDAQSVRDSSLYNEDLAPVPAERRTWGTYNYAALWIAMSVNIPTYLLASSMIAGGMSWKQAIFTVFLGNVLVLIPMLLNAHAGARVWNSVSDFRALGVWSAWGRTCPRCCARWWRADGSAFRRGSAAKRSTR